MIWIWFLLENGVVLLKYENVCEYLYDEYVAVVSEEIKNGVDTYENINSWFYILNKTWKKVQLKIY